VSATTSRAAADVLADLAVVGGGLIGLAIAATAAERGLSVALLTVDRPGAASRAAAGLLVPHYGGEGAHTSVTRFMAAAFDLYPAYVAWVEERSGVHIPLTRDGALQVAESAAECEALQAKAPEGAESLSPGDVAALEPALAPSAGGVFFPRAGAVDNRRLTDALSSIVERHPRARIVREAAVRLSLESTSPLVTGNAGTRVQGDRVVLAAGAWSGAIHGLPRPLPVRPLRGQICTIRGAPLRHVVLGRDVYMVGRGGDRTLVGSTMEDVGFDPRTTDAGIEWLHRAAAAACTPLAGETVLDAWSGLRPATPDLLPILGFDREYPRLIYACGHSRNGILLAPITAQAIIALAASGEPAWDLAPFAIDRFQPDIASR
jgi:glycine oxidase